MIVDAADNRIKRVTYRAGMTGKKSGTFVNHSEATVPMVVEPQPDGPSGTVVDRSVEMSTDDSASWKPVQVKDGVALVPHPDGSGFVSLRARATDNNGNTVTQTITRAYRYGPLR